MTLGEFEFDELWTNSHPEDGRSKHFSIIMISNYFSFTPPHQSIEIIVGLKSQFICLISITTMIIMVFSSPSSVSSSYSSATSSSCSLFPVQRWVLSPLHDAPTRSPHCLRHRHHGRQDQILFVFFIAKTWPGHKHCDHVKQACNVIDNILQMQIYKTIIHKV